MWPVKTGSWYSWTVPGVHGSAPAAATTAADVSGVNGRATKRTPGVANA